MRLTSLRSKIFMFMVTLLILGAGLVMFVTQHDVTRTVTTSEERAVDNVLNLLARDSVARWAGLLNEKATVARQARQPLIQYSGLIASVLDTYNQQLESGQLDQDQAQELALQWVNQLDIGKYRHALILDRDLRVLADSQQQLTGNQLAGRLDIKGRQFSDIAKQELGAGNLSFVIYRTTPDASALDVTELRYATFARFAAWDWTIAISDSAQHMIDQFDQQRLSMEAAVTETVESIKLVGSGFVFITDENGEPVTPFPEQHAGLLNATDPDSDGRTLPARLADTSPSARLTQFEVTPQRGDSPDTDDRWIIKTAYVKPLKWTVVAAVPAQELARPATELRNRLGMLFLAGLLAALFLTWILSARITRPLHQLSNFARSLPERDLTLAEPLPPHIEQLPHKYNDEVGDLAAAFIHMDTQLRDKVVHLLNETSRRERFESELNIARDIQMGLLPIDLSPAVLKKIDLHATMLPAKEVGGDLYDYFMLPDGRLCFAIGDVSDKGVPAALFMAVTRTLLRACAEDTSDPALLMERINTRLATNNPNMMFVTLIIGVLDMQDGTIMWANGGHAPLCILQHDGQLRMLEGRSGPACGVQAELPYRGFTATLDYDEMLFGYTDGIPEAMDPDQQQYGEERMFQQMQRPGALNLTAQPYAEAIIDDVRKFTRDNEQSDDITVITIKRITP